MGEIVVGHLVSNKFHRPVAFLTLTAGDRKNALRRNLSDCPVAVAV